MKQEQLQKLEVLILIFKQSGKVCQILLIKILSS